VSQMCDTADKGQTTVQNITFKNYIRKYKVVYYFIFYINLEL